RTSAATSSRSAPCSTGTSSNTIDSAGGDAASNGGAARYRAARSTLPARARAKARRDAVEQIAQVRAGLRYPCERVGADARQTQLLECPGQRTCKAGRAGDGRDVTHRER